MTHIQHSEERDNIRIGMSPDPARIKIEAGLGATDTSYIPCMWVQGLNGAYVLLDAKAALQLLDFLRGSEEELIEIMDMPR